MKILETLRLLLRPFTLEDAEDAYREIYADIEVVQHYSSLGVQNMEQVRARSSLAQAGFCTWPWPCDGDLRAA